MRRSTGLVRAFSRVTLVLQLLLPTVVSIADARLERNALSARAFTHVESKTGKDCPRVHKADCALCQHLTTPFAKTAKPEPPRAILRHEPPPVVLATAGITADLACPSLPRAPPAA